MLTLWGTRNRTCDGISRRDFLRVGALGLGGLGLADVLRLRGQAGTRPRARAVILVCLGGGPSHIDMYDLKPAAPAEIRGDFRPIRSRVPGFDLCELFPLQAQLTDQLAVVRTVQFSIPNHELREIFTGFPQPADRPCFGSVVSRFRGNPANDMPRYVSLDPKHAYDPELESPRYLGAAHAPFHLGYGAGQEVKNLSPSTDVPGARIASRKQLLARLDTLRRDLDARHEFASQDEFTTQALEMIASPRARAAFDLSREPDKVRDRYGRNQRGFWDSEKFLMARRLVEAGVAVVTLKVGYWDHHAGINGDIFTALRAQLPALDRSLAVLLSDLRERGLDKEVVVLVWGEFGRTPRVSYRGTSVGRDHWNDAGFALFSGGGLRMGQVIGETDSQAARPKNRPLNCQNVLATVYHALGIDPDQTVLDFAGRPQYLLDHREPIRELVG
jgi:hypothetical protein